MRETLEKQCSPQGGSVLLRCVGLAGVPIPPNSYDASPNFIKKIPPFFWQDPVSYTHLDVYKRQILSCENNVLRQIQNEEIINKFATTIVHRKKLLLYKTFKQGDN